MPHDKSPSPKARGRPLLANSCYLENLALRHYIFRLQPLGALLHLEFDTLPLIECLVSIRLNRRKVHKHVFSRLALNEAVTLRRVKPLHRTLLFAHGRFPCAEFAILSGVSKPAAGYPTGELARPAGNLVLETRRYAVTNCRASPERLLVVRSRVLAETAHRDGFIGVYVEHRVKFGDLQEVAHFSCKVKKFQFALAVLHGSIGVHQFADAGTINVIHV